jgi:hypothetical protein
MAIFETSLFAASYDSQGHGGDNSTPPPHGSLLRIVKEPIYYMMMAYCYNSIEIGTLYSEAYDWKNF